MVVSAVAWVLAELVRVVNKVAAAVPVAALYSVMVVANEAADASTVEDKPFIPTWVTSSTELAAVLMLSTVAVPAVTAATWVAVVCATLAVTAETELAAAVTRLPTAVNTLASEETLLETTAVNTVDITEAASVAEVDVSLVRLVLLRLATLEKAVAAIEAAESVAPKPTASLVAACTTTSTFCDRACNFNALPAAVAVEALVKAATWSVLRSVADTPKLVNRVVAADSPLLT